MLYFVNAVSLNMLPEDFSGSMDVTPLSKSDAMVDLYNSIVGGYVVPAIGHRDTAAVAVNDLCVHEYGPDWVEKCLQVADTRPTVRAQAGDILLVVQYRGPRLPEGATSLPEGARITYAQVKIR